MAKKKVKSRRKKESPEDLKRRALRLSRKLRKLYSGTKTALRFDNDFQLVVATILSAQCTDDQVNRVTPVLFKQYGTAMALARAKTAAIEKIIHSTGFFRQKTKSILALSKDLEERFGGIVPESMEELTSLPGVGRKTANLVRAEAFGRPGIVVDTHFRRLSQRLALVETSDPTKIEFRIADLLPDSHWTDFSTALIWHGRRICYAHKPDCPKCPVLSDCPFGLDATGKG